MDKKFTLGIIGAGNMASAIVGGILNSGLLSPDMLLISDLDDEKLDVFAKKHLAVTKDNLYLSSSCENLLFAVKPQCAPQILTEIKSTVTANLIISIMAGVSIDKLQGYLGNRNYARIMPNTPALIGEGMAAVAFSKNFRSPFVIDIFKSLGKVVELDETLFDAVTSLSGSGPAYVYLFIKALIDGGIEGGLSADDAKTLAIQTVIGSAKMVSASNKPIDQLIDAVCSKGGTTIQAVDSFKQDGLEEIVKRGIEKCRNRSKELGK
ncbi:MAG: pyrroline-5-carboxylate reductase [Clostridia bacterium]